MKKLVLLMVILIIGMCYTAQSQNRLTKLNRDFKTIKPVAGVDNPVLGAQTPNPVVSTKATMDDPITATTKYDFQTNGACLPHIYKYPDGTIATVATMSHLDDFSDRGTGYNYFNGTAWSTPPAARIETVRTGWPSYAPLGANGEIIVTHKSATGPLVICKRDNKGTGAWTESELAPPPDAGGAGMIWAKLVTNGTPRTNVHIICLTGPVANGGAIYQGLDGAILYNRSLDGGTTWDGWELLEGMTSVDYRAFSADAYAWAEPKGDILAFVVGDSWNDQFVMKSLDNGATWTKTKIWSCNFNLWNGGDTTGNFNCSDGSSSIALDASGKMHVVFGYMRANGNEAGEKFWFPFTDGLVYWNEDMDELPQELNADTLYAHGNYIGWVQDTMVWYAATTELAYYYVSMSSYPAMVIDNSNHIHVVWSGVTNLRDANSYMLRHLFKRSAKITPTGVEWEDEANIEDITADFAYNWTECVYPSASPTSDDKIYIHFQGDLEAGVYLNGSQGAQGQTGITNNDMIFLQAPIPTAIKETPKVNFEVAQNSPNPFRGSTMVNVQLEQPANLGIEVCTLMGQKVLSLDKGRLNAGSHQIKLDCSQLTSGIYFYTVKANNETMTKKMMVK